MRWLVFPRGHGYLPPDQAIAAAIADLKSFLPAFVQAMQEALRSLLRRFDPAVLEQELADASFLELLASGGRKARYWELFKERYRDQAREAEQQFLRDVGADIGRPSHGAFGEQAAMTLSRRLATALLACSALSACGLFGGDEPPPAPPPPPPPPPPPTIVSLTLKAAPDVNAEADGTGRPVQVRLLKLATANEFMEADFFALDADPSRAAGQGPGGRGGADDRAGSAPGMAAGVRAHGAVLRRGGGLSRYRHGTVARVL